MDSKVSALLTIPAVDRAADLLYIVDTSAGISNRVTPNGLLGITGVPVGTTDTQTLTNKTIGNTNIVTLRDDRFTLQDNGDITKQLLFQLSAITAGQTRTLSVPDRSSTIATLDGNQAFTGANSFTGSSWTGGTISNATVTVDSIAGFTTPNAGTIYGIAVSGGAIQSSSALAPGIVIPNILQSGTGTTWVWQQWVPVWSATTNSPTIGNGVYEAYYTVIGKTVLCRFTVTFGSTTNFASSSDWYFTLPVNARTTGYSTNQILGWWRCAAGGNQNHGTFEFQDATKVQVVQAAISGTRITAATVSSTSPGTWTNGDFISGTFVYEAA